MKISPPITTQVEAPAGWDLEPGEPDGSSPGTGGSRTAPTNSKPKTTPLSEAKGQNSKSPRRLHRYTLLAGLLIVFSGLVTFVAPTDTDVWWHLRNGQLIFDSGVPTRD